jgi:hypothetical protein
MTAYRNIDTAIRGLKYGIGPDGRIEGGWSCKESAGIEFGDPVFGYVGDSVSCYKFKLDTGKLVFDGDFVTSNVITITVNGVDAAAVTFDTDHDTTAALVVAAVAALDGVECVLDSTDTDNRTFLIQVKGETAVVAEAITGGAGQVTGTATYFSSQVFLGVALFDQNQPKLYEYQDAVNVMASGELWVQPVVAVEAMQVAYVDNAATDIGEFTISGSGVQVDAEYRSNASADGLARLRVNGQTQMTYAETFV